MIATTLCPSGQAHTFVNGCQTGPCAPIDPSIPNPGVCQEIPQGQYTTAQINGTIQTLINNWANDPGLPSCLNFLLHYQTSDGGTPTLPSGYVIPAEHPLLTGTMIVVVILVLLIVGFK